MARSWALPLLLLGGAVARLLLLGLGQLGRDEAAYLYWSRHPEPSYSPLLQLALRVVDLLPGDAVWLLRIPSLFGGLLALELVRRLAGSERRTLVLALFLSPWWVFANSLIHPDAMLLPALLLLLWAQRNGHAFGVGMACLLAAWAKPSGLVALPVACFFLLDPRLGGGARRLASSLLAAAGSLVVLPILQPQSFSALRKFASADPTVPWHWRAGMGLVALFVLPGPALLGAALRRHAAATIFRREALLPAAYFGAFAFAALFWGQFKPSWFLPAIVLWALLPTAGGGARRGPGTADLASAILCLLIATGLARPDWTESIESRIPALSQSYAAQAGGRENSVSSTGNWGERAREFQPMESFVDQLRREWKQADQPEWLLSDDYGLAAQILATWPLPECRMFLPDDGIFRSSWPPQALPAGARVLVLSVRRGPDAAWVADALGDSSLVWVAQPWHPIDHHPIALGIRTD